MDWSDRIGRKVTLRDLGILIKTVEAGSMSKATAQLRVSQPAISKTITNIERVLEAQLIKRSARGIEPTEHGRALIARSLAAFDELHRGIHAIQALSHPEEGELRIAANQFALSDIVASTIKHVLAHHPGITFDVAAVQTFEDQVRALTDGDVELVVGRVLPALMTEQLNFVELVRDDFVVVANHPNRWTHRKKVELAELADEAWVFPPPDSVSAQFMAQIFRASGLPWPRRTVVAGSIQFHQRMIVEKGFLSLFPRSLGRSSKGMAILPVAITSERQSIGILTLKHRTLSPLAKLFVEASQSVMAETNAPEPRQPAVAHT